MQLQKLETPGIAHYAWLIMDGGQAALVDPSRDVGVYLDAARAAKVNIRYVVETHRQEDFVMGARSLAARTGATIVNGDHPLFGHGDLRLSDGASFELGGLRIVALHTPGHTPEGMSYAVYSEQDGDNAWGIFTGDTLFFGTTGRTDLPDAEAARDNAGLLWDSVHEKLAGLGDTALILPAHGPGSVCGSGMAERPFSTLGAEKRYNEVFVLTRDAFAERKGTENKPRPPFFRHMEEVNLQGGLPPMAQPVQVPLLEPDEILSAAEHAVVIDTREPEAFAAAHAPGSHSVWLGGLPVFGGWIADADTPVYLVNDRPEDIYTAASQLHRIGIDNVQGALAGGFARWRNTGAPMASANVLTPAELFDHREEFTVLDVREAAEFSAGHIEGAHHVYVGELERRARDLELEPGEPLVVTCGVGHRAGLGVSILQRQGYSNVRNLLGGMSAWKSLGFDVAT